jgi:hypothetical protein
MQGKHRKQSRKQSGGAGAADYAISVYGNTDSQAANPSAGNVIAAHIPAPAHLVQTGGSGLKVLSPAVVGGAKRKRQGGNVLNDIAVPAVLLYANHAFSKGKRAYGKSMRHFKKKNRKTFRKRR